MNYQKFLIKKSKEKKINYMILRYFNVAGADLKLRSGLIDKKSSHLIKVACEVATNKKNFLKIKNLYRLLQKNAAERIKLKKINLKELNNTYYFFSLQ